MSLYIADLLFINHMKGTLSGKFYLVGKSMVQILSMYLEDSRMTVGPAF